MIHLHKLPNQREGEELILNLRRNWLTVASLVVVFSMMFIVPGALVVYFWEYVSAWLQRPVLGAMLTLLGSMYALSVWMFAFLEFTDYYLDTWIVTNERILSTEQRGLFNRVAAELHLAAVQDVTAEQKGMLGTFLDFGDVHVQTAAEKGRFHFDNIDHPERVKETIIGLVDDDKKRHAGHLIASVAEGTMSSEETA